MRLKALAEIYTMHSFGLLKNRIFSEKLLEFCQKIMKIFKKNAPSNLPKFVNF